MDLRKLKTMIDLVSESSIAELEVVEGESKIRISKIATSNNLASAPNSNNIHYIATQPAIHSVQSTNHGDTVDIAASPYNQDIVNSSGALHQLKCPMVGTFYNASSPGAESFVTIGTQVTVGQTMGIVEAMKLLNEIECDKSGIVKEILVENGQPVQYGQPLFVIQ